MAKPIEVPIRRLTIAVMIVVVSTLPVFLTGASFVQLREDIGLTATGLGVVTAAFFLTASLTSTPLGRMVERIGWKRAMRINCAVSATMVVLIALFASSTLTLGVLLVASGAVYGFANPAANHALAHGASASRRGLVFGLKHAGIPASTLAAGAAVPLFVLTVGWRPTFALGTVFAATVWVLIHFEPESAASRTGLPDGVQDRRPLTRRELATLAAGSAFATWGALYLGSFLVAAAVEASLTEAEAGLLLFAGSLVSIAARVVSGSLADRRGSQGFLGVSLLMGIGAIVFIGVAAAPGGVAFIAHVRAAFATGWGWPGLMTYSVVNANAGTPAASTAVTQAGIFLGAGLGPLAIGWVVDQWSFDVASLVVALMLSVAATIVGGLAYRRRMPRPEPTMTA